MALSDILLTTICGLERGGASLLLDMLRSHPQIEGGEDTHLLGYDDFGELRAHSEHAAELSRGWQLDEASTEYVLGAPDHETAFRRLRERSPAVKNKNARLIDKTTGYLKDLGEVLRRSDSAPVLVVLRDPKAVIQSILQKRGVSDPTEVDQLLPKLCDDLNENLLELEYALAQDPKRIQLISYELLCYRSKPLLKRLCHLLGVNWIDEMQWPSQRGDDFEGEKVSTRFVWEYRDVLNEAQCQFIEESVRDFPAGCPSRFSILMPVCDPPLKYLDEAISSILEQTNPLWELVITDDASTNPEITEFLAELPRDQIRVIRNEERQGISASLNRGLSQCWGNIVGTLDHDDFVDPSLLRDLHNTFSTDRADVVYTDEYLLTEDHRLTPFFKPDYSPDLLLGYNYFCHFVGVKKRLLRRIKGFDPAFDGAQDTDMVLKLTEVTDRISHLPKPLYFWRRHPGAFSQTNRRRRELVPMNVAMVENAMARRKVDCRVSPGLAEGTVRVQHKLKATPKISVIIPFRDRPDLLGPCLHSLVNRSTYPNFEIIAVDNGSRDPEIEELLSYYKRRLGDRFQTTRLDIPFNYGLINNDGVLRARGEMVVFLNNDTEVRTPDWLEAMLEHGQRDEVGAVGARLTYPNGTIQHAGVVIGFRGVAGHQLHGLQPQYTGYMYKPLMVQNLSAVTGACMMMRRQLFIDLGGFNTTDLKDDYTDVDLCLRIRETGKTVIYTPYAHLIHHGTASREVGDKKTLLEFSRYMYQRHSAIYTSGDPYYNPNFSLDYDHIPRNVINTRHGRKRGEMKPTIYETMNRFRPRTLL